MDSDVVHGDDVAVTQRRENAPFVQKSLGPLLGFRILENLQRHRPLQRFLRGTKHHGHAARADMGLDLITGYVQLCHWDPMLRA